MKSLVLLAAASCFAVINVPLEVSNWADAARTAEPVTAGVPLPEKGVYDLSLLRITDGSGNTLPCQFKPLSRWYREKHRDGVAEPSIKWVLCDFQADVAAKNRTSVFLKDDNTGAVPSTDLTLVETTSDITVVTGPLKFVISKTRFNLFDEAWLDADNNQAFEAAEKIFSAGNNSGGFITAGDWAAGECVNGTIHTTQGAVDRVVVEENGPMKILIRVEGRHFAASGGVSKGLYGYQVFITAYAGKPYVDVQWAVTNHYLEGDKPPESGTATPWTMYSWPFTRYTLSLDLNLNASSAQSGALLPDNEAVFIATTTPTVLDQRYLNYTCTGGATGANAKGGASLSDNALGVRVAMRVFGPNAPKTLSVVKNKIDIGLFPDTGGTVPYWLENLTRKNQRMRLEFFSGAPASGALSALWAKTDAPLRMLAQDPAWYRDTDAWERGIGLVPGTADVSYARMAPASWQRLDRFAKSFPGSDYDWQLEMLTWQCGGMNDLVPNFNSGGDHDNLTSMFYKWVLTGNPKAFEQAEINAHFFNDRIQVQYPHDVWQKMDYFLDPVAHKGEYTSGTHGYSSLGLDMFRLNAFPAYALQHGFQIPDDGHMTQLQEIEYYQLTGDPGTLDAMKGLAAAAALYAFEYNYIWRDRARLDSVDTDSIFQFAWGPRYMSRPVMVCMHAYDMTGDEQYLYPGKLNIYNMRNNVKRHPVGYLAPAGNTTYCEPGENPWVADHPGIPLPTYFSMSDFQIGIAMEAFYSYWKRTGDEEIRDALIFSGKFYTWFGGKDSLGHYIGWPYSGWSDYGWSGKRAASGFFAEAFGGLNFSYLVSGDSEFWKACKDGLAAWGPDRPLTDLKALNIYAATWKHSVDSTPPASIADLTAATEPTGGLRITWTAPGSNGNAGRAAQYQVKVAEAPIVDIPDRWNDSTRTGWPDLNDPLPYTNEDLVAKAVNFTRTQCISFWAAKNMPGEPVPATAGSQESMVLTGLDTNTSYHIAIVAWDSNNNVSGLSNVATGTTGAEIFQGGNKGLALLGNSPNPFNPSTAIRFHVPATLSGKPLTLCIYDVRGKLVKTLLQSPAKAGMQTVTWNSRTASGLYVMRLVAGKRKIEKQMILLK